MASVTLKKKEQNNEFLKKDYGDRQDEIISFAEWSSVANWGLAKSLSPVQKRVWVFQSSECRTLLEKIHKLEMGQGLCQMHTQKRVRKKDKTWHWNFILNFIKIIIVTEWKCSVLKYDLFRWFFSPFYSRSFHNALIISESSIWLGEDALRCKCASFTWAFYMLFIILYMHAGILHLVELLTCSSN